MQGTVLVTYIKIKPVPSAFIATDEVSSSSNLALDDFFSPSLNPWSNPNPPFTITTFDETTGVLQNFWEDNTDPRILTPWKEPYPQYQNEDDIGIFPTILVEPDPFIPYTPQSLTSPTLLFDTENLPIAAVTNLIDEDIFLTFLPWNYTSSFYIPFDPDSIPSNFLDEDFWFNFLLPQLPITSLQPSKDDNDLAIFATPVDEDLWNISPPWLSLYLPYTPSDNDIVPSNFLDEDFSLQFLPWTTIAPLLLPYDNDIISTTPATFDEDFSQSWPIWPQLYTNWNPQQDSEIATFANFPLDEFFSIPPSPWLQPYGQVYSFKEETYVVFVAPPVNTLYIIELNIVPSADGIVQLQVGPVAPATSVTVRQGSLGFLNESKLN